MQIDPWLCCKLLHYVKRRDNKTCDVPLVDASVHYGVLYLQNNNVNGQKWKCNLTLDMIDCMYELCQYCCHTTFSQMWSQE